MIFNIKMWELKCKIRASFVVVLCVYVFCTKLELHTRILDFVLHYTSLTREKILKFITKYHYITTMKGYMPRSDHSKIISFPSYNKSCQDIILITEGVKLTFLWCWYEHYCLTTPDHIGLLSQNPRYLNNEYMFQFHLLHQQ